MLEAAVLGAFCAALIACLALDVPIVVALAAGLVLFVGYGLARGHRLVDIARMGASGVATSKGVLEAFALIGVLTAFWRASGTVSEIVVLTAPLIVPAAVPLAAFALTSVMSFLIGTSFGTAATMGVVCMAVARSMGANELLVGGAVLASAYFGDRCSPMSTSALLVRTITHVDFTPNFRAMMRSAAVPLVVTLAAYALAGAALVPDGVDAFAPAGDVGAVAALRAFFSQGPVALLPAAPVLVLPLLRVGVKASMAVSIVLAAGVGVAVGGVSMEELLGYAVWGYSSADPAVGALMDGGGLLSMANVALIVCLSSSYAGIFQGTGLLDGMRAAAAGLARRATPFGAVLVVSGVASMVACNQTLSIMLTHQLCREAEPDAGDLALALEDSAVLLPALVPWSIACAAPLGMCGAPQASVLAACYLWLVPVWHLGRDLVRRYRARLGNPACA